MDECFILTINGWDGPFVTCVGSLKGIANELARTFGHTTGRIYKDVMVDRWVRTSRDWTHKERFAWQSK